MKLLAMDVKVYSLPFFRLEIALEILFYLQLLKFSVDYFPGAWFGGPQAILLYLDLSYYLNFVSPTSFFDFLIVCMVGMSLYWMLPLLLYLYGIERSNSLANANKAVYLLAKNVLLLPAFIVLLE